MKGTNPVLVLKVVRYAQFQQLQCYIHPPCLNSDNFFVSLFLYVFLYEINMLHSCGRASDEWRWGEEGDLTCIPSTPLFPRISFPHISHISHFLFPVIHIFLCVFRHSSFVFHPSNILLVKVPIWVNWEQCWMLLTIIIDHESCICSTKTVSKVFIACISYQDILSDFF